MGGERECDSNLLDLYLSAPANERRQEFISTAVAARWCGVSQRTIENWIEAGRVGAVRIGWKYLVFRPALKAYLEDIARN